MKLAVFDYGAGNLHSLLRALTSDGVTPALETDPRALARADAIVLPGVGAFGAAAQRLAPGRSELLAALRGGVPCLGVCLGMQLLFERSAEGAGAGLGLIAGDVKRLDLPRVPHMGWNVVTDVNEPLLEATPLSHAYFAHSFACVPADPAVVTAVTEEHGQRIVAAVRTARTLGVQFHPEKSGAQGVAFVRAFVREAAACV
jgi:glutamine amidotransferase